MPRPERNRRNPARRALPALFLLSGAAGLAYEVLWREELARLFGRTWEATAAVLAVLMAGLGLGAALAGRRADRLRRPLLAYGLLEAALAPAALAAPLVLAALHPLYGQAWRALGPGPILTVIRISIAAAALLPPALLMGATLPVLARFAAGGAYRRELPLLYGANTAGAAGGALAAAFLLVPRLGRSGALWAAAGTTLALAAAALLLARREEEPAPAPAAAGGAPAGAPPLPPGAVAFLSGLAILHLEVLWTHHLALTLGSSVHAFGLMLAAFLAGLGGASWLCARGAARRLGPWRLVGIALTGGGLAVAAATPLLGLVPWAAAFLGRHLGDRFLLFSLARFAAVLVLLGGPALLLGLALPALMADAGGGREGRTVGSLYALNTAGAVAGPLLAGLATIPLLGARQGLLATAALLLLLGLLLAWRRRRGLGPALGAAALGLGAGLLAPWDLKVVASGLHLYGGRHGREGLGHALEREEILHLAEGAQGTVAVMEIAAPDGSRRRTYSMNGKFEGSTNPADMYTQTRVGELPLLACPREPRAVFLLGLGTGVTLASLLRFPLAEVDLCELSPEVIEVARRWFRPWNHGCLDDPRLRLLREDGRTWLALSGRRYDVVISEPSNPWMAGVADLFTREAFAAMAGAVADGGVACQWVQAYLLAEERFRMVLRTWLAVFPRSIAVLSHLETTDVLLVGFVDRRAPAAAPRLDAAAIAARLAARRPYPCGEGFAPESAVDLLQGFLAGPERLLGWAGAGPLHTDDRPRLQFEAPLDLHDREARLERWPRLPGFAEPAGPPLVAGLAPEEERRLRDTFAWLEARLILKGLPWDAPEVPAAYALELIHKMDARTREPAWRECWVPPFLAGCFLRHGPVPGRPDRLALFAPGFPRAGALAALTRAARLAEGFVDPWLRLAETLERGADGKIGGPESSPEEALAAARQAAALAPRNEEAVLLAARLLLLLDREEEAREEVEELLRRLPGSRPAREWLERLPTRRPR